MTEKKRELNLDPTDVERFWANVDKKNGCWEYKRRDPSNGYGRIFFKKRRVKAHRFSWMLKFGIIPKGLGVLHKCDNPPCVRPSHLFLGDQKANRDDMIMKGRARILRGEDVGTSRLTKADVLYIRKHHVRGKHSHDPGNTSELMKKFSVSRNSILRAADRVWWRHL